MDPSERQYTSYRRLKYNKSQRPSPQTQLPNLEKVRKPSYIREYAIALLTEQERRHRESNPGLLN